jgi:hypothetical protein
MAKPRNKVQRSYWTNRYRKIAGYPAVTLMSQAADGTWFESEACLVGEAGEIWARGEGRYGVVRRSQRGSENITPCNDKELNSALKSIKYTVIMSKQVKYADWRKS